MAVALRQDYRKALDEQNKEVQNLVLAGLEQIKEGKTQNFDSVCDRLEKKYNACRQQNVVVPYIWIIRRKWPTVKTVGQKIIHNLLKGVILYEKYNYEYHQQ